MIGPRMDMTRRARRAAVAADLRIPKERFAENDACLRVGHVPSEIGALWKGDALE
jgi:hypothetical protein